MDLRDYLRIKVNEIRKMNLKDRCECCESKTNLTFHHNVQFSELVKNVLAELDIEFKDTEFYSNEEISMIENMCIEKHMNIKYTTLCYRCHKLLHTGLYLKENYIREYQNRNKKITGFEFIYNGINKLLLPNNNFDWMIDEYQQFVLCYLNGFNSLNGVNCTLSDIILRSNCKLNRNKGKSNDMFKEAIKKLIKNDIIYSESKIEVIKTTDLINFKINMSKMNEIEITYEMIKRIKKFNGNKLILLIFLYKNKDRFKDFTTSIPVFISKKTGISTLNIIKNLKELQSDGLLILKYNSSRHGITP